MRYQEEEYPNFDEWYKSFFLVFQVRTYTCNACMYIHVLTCISNSNTVIHGIISRNIGGNWFGLQLPFGIGLPYVKEILVLTVSQAGCQTMKFTMYMYM